MAGDVWFHVRHDPLYPVCRLYVWPYTQPWPPPVLVLSCFGKYSTLPCVICSRNLVLMWIALHYWHIKPLCVLAWGQRVPLHLDGKQRAKTKQLQNIDFWRVGYWCISKFANTLSSNINLAYAFVKSSQCYAAFKANIFILGLLEELFVTFLTCCLCAPVSLRPPVKIPDCSDMSVGFTLYWSVINRCALNVTLLNTIRMSSLW